MARMLLTIPDGTHLPALLHSGLLARLAANPDTDWVVLSPLARDPKFTALLAELNVEVRCLEQTIPRFGGRQIELVRRELIKLRLDAVSQHVLHARLPARERRRNRVHRWAARALGWIPACDSGLNRIQDILPTHAETTELLDDCRPDVVVLGSGAVKFSDVEVGRWAKRRRLPILSLISSWDNLSFKGPTVRADRLTVWNEPMRADAQRLYGYRADQVAVVGAPAFDGYANYAPKISRAEFLASLKLPPNRKLVTYATMPPTTANFGANFVRGLADWVAGDALAEPSCLLVRLHPLDNPQMYAGLRDLPLVYIDEPHRDRPAADWKAALANHCPTSAEAERLRESLWFSDVVVNIASTVTLEACALDRPVINLAYNPAGTNWPFSIAEYQRVAHYAPVAESGAVYVADSPDSLKAGLNEALCNPASRQAARASLVRSLLMFTDGSSTARTAETILAFCQEHSKMPSAGYQRAADANPPSPSTQPTLN